jgi:SAM-dependent methyltransferase
VEATHWDERYAQRDLVWGAEPNRWVAQECAALPPGRALDVACGEGRNTLWLAGRGWQVTGVDFSAVALHRAGELAERAGVPDAVRWVRADLREYRPEPDSFDLVMIVYLQLPADQRRTVVRQVAAGLAPGGTLLVVAHDSANLTQGHGGPQDPLVLYTAADVADDLAGLDGVTVQRAESVLRPVEVDGGTRQAVDALLLARRGAPAL